jgi:hypothetical protein
MIRARLNRFLKQVNQRGQGRGEVSETTPDFAPGAVR